MSSRLSGGRFSISDMLVVVRPLTPAVELSRSRSVAHVSHSSLTVGKHNYTLWYSEHFYSWTEVTKIAKFDLGWDFATQKINMIFLENS